MSRVVVERVDVRLAIAHDVLAPIRNGLADGDEVRVAIDEILARIEEFKKQLRG